MPTFRTAFGKNPRVQFATSGKSMTHQAEAPACDINTIMAKYQKTGILEHRNTFEGQYGNFADAPQDYHEAMNAVLEANEMFEALPSQMRRRFHNDPGAFVDFVANPENADELVKLGLARASQTPSEVIESPKPDNPAVPPETQKTPAPKAEKKPD